MFFISIGYIYFYLQMKHYGDEKNLGVN
jgi:hypothetical protein